MDPLASCNQFSEVLGIPSTEPPVHHNRFIVIHGRLYSPHNKRNDERIFKNWNSGSFRCYIISPLSNCWRPNLSRQLFRMVTKRKKRNKKGWNKFRFWAVFGWWEGTNKNKNMMNYTFLIRLQKNNLICRYVQIWDSFHQSSLEYQCWNLMSLLFFLHVTNALRCSNAEVGEGKILPDFVSIG